MVQVYSLGYMSEESPARWALLRLPQPVRHSRCWAWSPRTTRLQTYVFWELVGLGSYLLIGFWYHKPEASRAAMKAFWTTRLGDVGFALGVIFLWSAGGSFVFAELFAARRDGRALRDLPDAGRGRAVPRRDGQERPVPVPHLAARRHGGPDPGLGADPRRDDGRGGRLPDGAHLAPARAHAGGRGWVLGLGVFTAFLAATMALVARDVKRILAFSTVSQLGYMMAAVGAGGDGRIVLPPDDPRLLQGAAVPRRGQRDPRGAHQRHLRDGPAVEEDARHRPLLPDRRPGPGRRLPLAGFFSKDEILIDLWVVATFAVAFWTLLVTAGLTAFYMFRAFFVVFFGDREFGALHAHESPAR